MLKPLKLIFLFIAGIFLFSGCAAVSSKELLHGKSHHSIIKGVDVKVNLRKDLRQYFAAGLQGGLDSIYEKGSTYSVATSVRNTTSIDPREIQVFFSDQHKKQVMKISMEVDSDTVDERRFQSTLSIAVGEVIKNVKKYNNDKEACLCHASGVDSEKTSPELSAEQTSSSYSAGVSPSGSVLTGLAPIPLPRI